MKEFALVVEYGTGKAVMLTDTPDIFIALNKFHTEMQKALPFEQYKDFALPTILSCEILPVNQNTYNGGKKYALVVQYKYGRSVMVTDAFQLDTALDKLIKAKQEILPEDEKNSVLLNVQGCELYPVLYESIYE